MVSWSTLGLCGLCGFAGAAVERYSHAASTKGVHSVSDEKRRLANLLKFHADSRTEAEMRLSLECEKKAADAYGAHWDYKRYKQEKADCTKSPYRYPTPLPKKGVKENKPKQRAKKNPPKKGAKKNGHRNKMKEDGPKEAVKKSDFTKEVKKHWNFQEKRPPPIKTQDLEFE